MKCSDDRWCDSYDSVCSNKCIYTYAGSQSSWSFRDYQMMIWNYSAASSDSYDAIDCILSETVTWFRWSAEKEITFMKY